VPELPPLSPPHAIFGYTITTIFAGPPVVCSREDERDACAVESAKPTAMEGWLNKYSSHLEEYQPHFCKLANDGILRMYCDKDGLVFIGAIDLCACRRARRTIDFIGHYEIELLDEGGRTYTFKSVDGLADVSLWLDAMAPSISSQRDEAASVKVAGVSSRLEKYMAVEDEGQQALMFHEEISLLMQHSGEVAGCREDSLSDQLVMNFVRALGYVIDYIDELAKVSFLALDHFRFTTKQYHCIIPLHANVEVFVLLKFLLFSFPSALCVKDCSRTGAIDMFRGFVDTLNSLLNNKVPSYTTNSTDASVTFHSLLELVRMMQIYRELMARLLKDMGLQERFYLYIIFHTGHLHAFLVSLPPPIPSYPTLFVFLPCYHIALFTFLPYYHIASEGLCPKARWRCSRTTVHIWQTCV
jgi:hypothetical protein